jgi:hypothetical protein
VSTSAAFRFRSAVNHPRGFRRRDHVSRPPTISPITPAQATTFGAFRECRIDRFPDSRIPGYFSINDTGRAA